MCIYIYPTAATKLFCITIMTVTVPATILVLYSRDVVTLVETKLPKHLRIDISDCRRCTCALEHLNNIYSSTTHSLPTTLYTHIMASQHISHASNPMKALYSIFVQPALTASRAPRPQLLSTRTTTAAAPASPHTRTFTTSQPLALSKKKPARVAEVREHKWNEEITARVIKLVNPATNLLDEPVTRYDVLNSLDLKTHRLVQITKDAVPVCKIVSKKEEYAADKRRKEQQKEIKQAAAKERSIKTLELNWAIDGNDLAHRLEKVRDFLEEGRKVEIVLAAKKRGRKASKEECEEVLAKIREVVEGVRGAKEPKPFEGVVGGFATMVFQGKAGAAVPAAAAQEQVKA